MFQTVKGFQYLHDFSSVRTKGFNNSNIFHRNRHVLTWILEIQSNFFLNIRNSFPIYNRKHFLCFEAPLTSSDVFDCSSHRLWRGGKISLFFLNVLRSENYVMSRRRRWMRKLKISPFSFFPSLNEKSREYLSEVCTMYKFAYVRRFLWTRKKKRFFCDLFVFTV